MGIQNSVNKALVAASIASKSENFLNQSKHEVAKYLNVKNMQKESLKKRMTHESMKKRMEARTNGESNTTER